MSLFINPNPHIVTFTTGHKDSRKQHQIMPQGSKGAMPTGAIYEIDLADDSATKELVKTGMLKAKVAAPVPAKAPVVSVPVAAAPTKVTIKGGKPVAAPEGTDDDEG